MADNNLDIRARLTGEDRLSSTVVKLLAKIKSLETQMQKLGKAGNSISDIPMEKYVKQLNAGSKALNGLTTKHLNWAKANGVAGKEAQLTWGKLTNDIIKAAKEHEKYTQSTARGSKKRAKAAQDELALHYKNAVAFKYLYNKVGDQRLDMQRRVTEQLGNLEAAHLRSQERHHRNHLQNLSRMRQQAMRSMSQMSNIGNRAIPYAAAAAGATGYAGVSALRTRMRMDTAETNMQIFGGLDKDQVKKMRKDWGNADAIKFGLSPDAMMNSYTEVIKAGIPEKIAKAVTESIVKSSIGLEMDSTQTTKLAGSAATLLGDMKNLDPKKIDSIMGAIAIAARDSKADANEIVAANKRGSSVMAMGMSMEDLSAFTAGGISAGIQQGKAGTMMDHLVSEMLGARFKTGKRGNDLGKAASLLGLGGKQGLSSRMASNPTETLMTILDKMGSMKPLDQERIAQLIGQDQWSGELLQMVQVREKVREILTNIKDPKNKNFNDEAAAKKMQSLAGRWNSMATAFTLLWEATGAGFEKMFTQFTDFFTNYGSKVDLSKITETVEAFTDGMVQGLGYESWTAMLQDVFGSPETVRSYGKEVGGFAKGFMSGMRELYDGIKFVVTGLISAFGLDSKDPEAMGKFTARLIEFGVALKTIGTLGEALSGIVSFVKGLAAAVMLAPEFFAALAGGGVGAYIGKKARNWWDGSTPPDPKDSKSAAEHDQKLKDYSKKNEYNNFMLEGLKHQMSYRSSGGLAQSLDKFTGRVELAAFRGGTGGGLQNAMFGGSGGGSYSGGGLGGGSRVGGLPGLMTSKAGSALPSMGGGIIRRDNIPSFNGSGGSLASAGELNRAGFDKVFGGTPMAGKYDQIVAAAKANGISPSLLASVMAQESGGGKFLSGNNPGGVMDPSTNWSKKMQFANLDAGISKTASTVAKNYQRAGGDMSKLAGIYAPQGAANDPGGLNKNWLPGVQGFMGKMGGGNGAGGGSAPTGDAVGIGRQYLGANEYTDTQRLAGFLGADPRGKSNAWCARFVNKSLAAAGGQGTGSAVANSFQKWGSAVSPSDVKRNDVLLQTHGLGYNQPGGHVGMATGETRMVNGRMQVKMLAGNDGDSVREHWIDADKNLMVRRGNSGIPQGMTDQVPPSSLIQNVPSAPAPAAGGGGMGGGGGGAGGGHVQIHINGNSHDPEALATLVQRRVDESMNWRTHDTASEYT